MPTYYIAYHVYLTTHILNCRKQGRGRVGLGWGRERKAKEQGGKEQQEEKEGERVRAPPDVLKNRMK